jgi:DNA-binding NtrC family response regulator
MPFDASEEPGLTIGGPDPSEFIEGVGQSMRALETVVRELAKSEVPVLLLGERGAGKEATARHIHQSSVHCGEPFYVEPCSTLAPGQLGRVEGGTLRGTMYFEEVADLSVPCQELFLAVVARLERGGDDGQSTLRVVCGSSHDLEAEVHNGRFREDLYYRISGVCLRIPPLRQRREDIPQLISHFLEKYACEFGRPAPTLSAETQRLFSQHSWPGNVRELEDAVRAIVALGDESVAMGGLRQRWSRLTAVPDGERVSLKQASRAASREAEKELILRVLDRTRWNRKRAAQELQISYKALLYKLKQIGGEQLGASEAQEKA